MKKHILVAAIAVLAVIGTTKTAMALSWTGALSGNGDGITATEQWNSALTTLEWTVTQTSGGWNYNYVFTAPEKSVSHLIIECSENYTSTRADLFIDDYGPDTQGGSNPNIPALIHGIKLNNSGGTNSLTLAFESTHPPVWGDFYAKSGGKPGQVPTAWNTGFSSAFDPDDYIWLTDKSAGMIAVPDTVPEPTGLLMLGAPLGMLALGRIRKMLQ